MKHIVLSFLTVLLLPLAVVAAPKIGEKAPAFSEKGQDGKTYSLDQFEGKYVVLEWYNKDCPYVRKHYSGKNMQKLQKEFTKKGVAWFSVISSAPGKQGYLDAAEAVKDREESGAKNTAILIDPDGSMGRAYAAKVTPHMYVINPEGVLVYQGAIDDNNSSSPSVIPDSENYVVAALNASMAGKPVQVAESKPYGCSVKYK